MLGCHRRLGAAAAGSGVAVVTASFGVSGGLAAARRTHTLDGTFSLSGRPIGVAPRQVRYMDSATGTCTGRIDGVYQGNAPVRWRARGSGMIGCSGAHTRSAGTLTFPVAHAHVLVRTQGFGVGVVIAATIRGRESGSGVVAVVLQGDQTTTAACLAGTLSSAGEQLTGHMLTPIVGLAVGED